MRHPQSHYQPQQPVGSAPRRRPQPQQQQQYPQHQPRQQPSANERRPQPPALSDVFASGEAHFMQDMAMGIVNQNMNRFSWFSWGYFRKYFAVDHSYVFQKVKAIFLPCFHRSWKREKSMHRGAGATDYALPVDDVNAPDLYIPLMSFITYTLLMGYMIGAMGSFTPEVLIVTATSAFVVLVLENLFLTLGMYLLSVPFQPSVLDMIAYTCYKFVPVNLTLAVWVLFSHSTLYYITVAIAGTSSGMFFARTMRRVFLQDTSKQAQQTSLEKAKQTYFLIAAGLLQVPICLFLGRR